MSVARLSLVVAWQGALVGLLVVMVPAGAFLLGDAASSVRSGDGLVMSADALLIVGFFATVGLGVGASIGAALGLISGLVVVLCAGRVTTPVIVAAAAAAAAAALAALVLVIGGNGEPGWSFSLWLITVVLAGLPLTLAVAKEAHRVERRRTP